MQEQSAKVKCIIKQPINNYVITGDNTELLQYSPVRLYNISTVFSEYVQDAVQKAQEQKGD